MTPFISSTTNSLVKRIRALRQKKFREEQGAFFVEGIGPVWQAVDHHAPIETLVVAPDLLTSEAARQLIERVEHEGTRVTYVTASVFEHIAERDNPSGLGAVVAIQVRTLADLAVTPEAVWVALEEVGNPGNLGTILRTLDAVGGSGAILLGESTDPYHPTAVKASMGTLFARRIVLVPHVDDLVSWARTNRLQVVTTSAHAPHNYWQAAYTRPLVLLFGSEGKGLGDETLARGDISVRIPMEGSATSLNLAISVGVLLYEVKRRFSV